MEEEALQIIENQIERFLEAIRKDNSRMLPFNKNLVSDSSSQMIVDYYFDEGVVIRRTLGKLSYYEKRTNFPDGLWGEPLLERIEFIAPDELKGRLLTEPIYLDS